MRIPILLVILALCTGAHAATITGTVYNLNLDILQNAIVELREPSTGQTQRVVSKDGTFTFQAGPGGYQLVATHDNLAAVDTLIVQDDTPTIHDIILIDSIDDLELLLAESQEQLITDDDLYAPSPFPYWIFGLLVLLIAISIIVYRYMRPTTKEPKYLTDDTPSLKHDVLAYIEQEQGRTTQKAIRQHFPLSEAKISLVLTELEHEGKVKKIKKGRTNIIIKNA